MTNVDISDDGKYLTIRLSMTFKKSSRRVRIVAPDGASPWRPEPALPNSALLNAVARAYRWKQMMESGEFGSLKELAKAEQINFSYVCRILRLALLSPKIIESILDGRQAQTLELRHLLKPLPLSWTEQEAALAS